jgi:transposase
MDIVHPRVAGIDVHKKVIWVAVRLPGGGPGERAVTVRRFATFWRQLQTMAAWLAGLGVTDAAMESTGVYWWPVYHALAGEQIEVCVCNAAHMRNVPGRKTDLRDCQWIAELHEHGLVRPSFIPAAEVAALRQRTRHRKKLIERRISEGQRLTKVPEDAGIKIDSVASDLLGVSGRAMIEALIAGERDLSRLADLARGCCAVKSRACRWPATAGSPPRMARCAGCTWMPTTISPPRSPNWTSWSPRRPGRSRRSSPGRSPSRGSGSAPPR